jgi:SAM-dependent methyltransferase
MMHNKYNLRNFIIRIKELLLWDFYYNSIRDPKKKGMQDIEPMKTCDEIIKQLTKNKLKVHNYEIDLNDYRNYINKAKYQEFPKYYKGGRAQNFIEKTLEHYLAAKLLELSSDDVYLDIASFNSPATEIYQNIYGCKTYKQDLVFPEGIHDDLIGGNASNLPVENGFATKMALHCSFEHFENDCDVKFIKEANRVLSKGGKLCIIPLYLHTKYVIITDPATLPWGGIEFDENAVIYCVKGFHSRYGRFYDVPQFIDRIGNNLDELSLKLFAVKNQKSIDPSCYVKFVALFEKD